MILDINPTLAFTALLELAPGLDAATHAAYKAELVAALDAAQPPYNAWQVAKDYLAGKGVAQ
jgi:hypothetical protein